MRKLSLLVFKVFCELSVVLKDKVIFCLVMTVECYFDDDITYLYISPIGKLVTSFAHPADCVSSSSLPRPCLARFYHSCLGLASA